MAQRSLLKRAKVQGWRAWKSAIKNLDAQIQCKIIHTNSVSKVSERGAYAGLCLCRREGKRARLLACMCGLSADMLDTVHLIHISTGGD